MLGKGIDLSTAVAHPDPTMWYFALEILNNTIQDFEPRISHGHLEAMGEDIVGFDQSAGPSFCEEYSFNHVAKLGPRFGDWSICGYTTCALCIISLNIKCSCTVQLGIPTFRKIGSYFVREFNKSVLSV